MKFARVILILSLTISSIAATGQMTRIRGVVTDASSGEPIALATIAVPGTTLGVSTNFEGKYFIETRQEVTEIVALVMSYAHQSAKVTPRAYNEINFALEPTAVAMDDIIIHPSEDPAYEILRKVSRHKPQNDPSKREAYTYSTYTKMELALANMKAEFRSKRMQRNFGFVYEYMDTSALTGKAYLPVMISEASADYYYQKSPRVAREVVKASRISGIEQDQTLAQFTGHLHVNINLYENYINIFEVNFASPLSDHGSLYYKYYLVDSLNIEGRKTYKIRFRPRSKANAVFEGEVHIDSLSWALESANIQMAKGLNVNWIRELQIENKNQLINDSIWFVKQDKLIADFSLEMRDSARWVSFLGRRQVDYSEIKMGAKIPPEIARLSNDLIMSDTTLINDEQFWKSVRPYELSEREQGIYEMVEQVKDAPLFRTIYDLLNMAFFGYYDVGKVGFGPYYKLFSFNKLEGERFQIGVRTNRKFSEKVRLTGYGAYSTKGDNFKGGATVELMFSQLPLSKLTLDAKRDVTQLGSTNRAIATGNILSSIFARGSNKDLTLVNQYSIKYEKEWFQGFINALGFEFKQMFPTRYVRFTKPDGTQFKRLNTAEVMVGMRISKNEVVIRRTFDNIYMATNYPVINIDLAAGLKNALGGDWEYYRTELSLRQRFHIAPLGRSTVVFAGGKIFGKVPYPLLKLHEGNATYFYDPLAFSCMNFYEFASDLWGSIFWEHHFHGFSLDKIPLIKRLRWREVFTVKALWGKISKKNDGRVVGVNVPLEFPLTMGDVSTPYVEMGVGIENILRIFRIDAVWRVTHRGGKKGDNFAVNISMRLDF